ncbi:MAG: hypothetical protein JRN26_08195 [Nitrososphaerota archaeon]|jgi:uncharacterized membrane protein|nr:hypothetical protein [Nitrososphaerota archaeon]MDG6927985.1 hypothetical protein [Nitrososphaerota archaeon]MDG6929654.1 hypothetical protein [Nitrososphaerota archaeon]MDG6932837.1 hypothetical protein [Nitrososphaerota archaeon]MDG6936840.1 hypothetical protein [Nitrososphaerota archaeon]
MDYSKIIKQLKKVEMWYVLAFLLIASGLISFVLGKPLIPLASIFTSNSSYQTLFETILIFLINLMGIGGVFLIAKVSSTREVRFGRFYVAGGLALLIMWFAIMYELYITVYG